MGTMKDDQLKILLNADQVEAEAISQINEYDDIREWLSDMMDESRRLGDLADRVFMVGLARIIGNLTP